MKKLENLIKAKIVLRPSHPALKAAVIILVLFSMAAMIALSWVHGAIQDRTQALRDEAAAVEFDNEKLEKRLEDPDSVENVRAIASEELGLVSPGTVIIDPKS